MKRIHFIAIGGSAMHNLAIALHLKGYNVTGSDDEVFEPSKSRLQKYNLLPDTIGWNPDKITTDLDAVILGMHARQDNPELIRAQELGIKIYSYPEYLYEQSKDKLRVVIGGSHGKTTITSMIIHVLNKLNIPTDYMVGAQLQGFDVMVKLSENAHIMILEGDEYLTSPIDRRPKFHLYKPNIGLINGIAWDHINVFPTFDNYVEQFRIFANLITDDGVLLYNNTDEITREVALNTQRKIKVEGYDIPSYEINNEMTFIIHNGIKYPLHIFGKHNLTNLCGAWKVCRELNIIDEDFLNAISTFTGASKRLELVDKSDTTAIYKDFAHSPSKLKATITAVKEQYPNRILTACLELHTFSSLNKKFLSEYKDCMNLADEACVYFNPATIEHKKLEAITIDEVKQAFGRNDLTVFNSSPELVGKLLSTDWGNRNLLLMSSGNFDGIIFEQLAKEILKK
jgi:UDP-N-acetylmuramate: L-alanyl-gamma-D-glutamyl-meso-diaminopimelate ligase